MEKTFPNPGSTHWQPDFERLLQTVKGSGSHGSLVDIRESLRQAIGRDRPLVMLCPHADDGAITASCLMHEYAIRRGLPVIEVLVFAGERNVAAPWLNDKKKVSVRESEFRLECNVLGAEAVCWDLDAYRSRQVGFVFQSFHLLPTLNAVENVQVPMFEGPWPRAERASRAERLLEEVGLAHRRKQLPNRLSVGERQRV
ncbi:ATP-binding cassette domain-containing protein, partial [Singulisphaera rosea]